MQAEPIKPDTSKPRRTFTRETVRVDSHGSNGPYNPRPAVNVKVRKGFESLKPEDWDSIRATVLDSEAGLFERWAFFEEVCETLAQETPYRCADLLAVNVFAREETSREVEYLRALDGGRWDTVRFSVPNRVEDADALVAYLEEHAPERVPDFAHVFVLRDPAPKVTAEELEAD